MRMSIEVLKKAEEVVASLPKKPIEYSIIGSMSKIGRSFHDIDLFLLYRSKEVWMEDKYVRNGFKIPFDLFFFIPPDEQSLEFFINDAKQKREQLYLKLKSESHNQL